jgi:hypothetical protein
LGGSTCTRPSAQAASQRSPRPLGRSGWCAIRTMRASCRTPQRTHQCSGCSSGREAAGFLERMAQSAGGGWPSQLEEDGPVSWRKMAQYLHNAARAHGRQRRAHVHRHDKACTSTRSGRMGREVGPHCRSSSDYAALADTWRSRMLCGACAVYLHMSMRLAVGSRAHSAVHMTHAAWDMAYVYTGRGAHARLSQADCLQV